MKNIIFLDIDGVLNCQITYEKQPPSKKSESTFDFRTKQIDKERIKWLNELCRQTDSAVVISSTWRNGISIEDLRKIFEFCGATFDILDKTPSCQCRTRGCEISNWLSENCMKYFGVEKCNFKGYAIIDDDSDMLLDQQPHFFQTDPYSGLTPNTCYRILRFLK